MRLLNQFTLDKPVKLCSEQLTKNQLFVFLSIIIISVILKIIIIPYNMMDMGDSATRVWNAWWWAEKPFFVMPESSNPLWFYLMGPLFMLTKEFFYTSIITMILLMTISGLFLFKATVLISDFKTAVLAFCIFMFNPVIFRLNFEPYSQQPYLAAVCITVYYLLSAISSNKSTKYFIIAGIFSFLALATRPEALFLIPIFCLYIFLTKLSGRWYFIILSMLFPVIWVVVSQLIYGTPFKTIQVADQYTDSINIQGWNLTLRAMGFFLPYYFMIIGLTVIVFWFFFNGYIWSYKNITRPATILITIPILIPAFVNGLASVKSTIYHTVHYVYLMYFFASIFAAIGLRKYLDKINSTFIRTTTASLIILSSIPFSYAKEFVPLKLKKAFPRLIQFVVTVDEPDKYKLINFIDGNINNYPSLIFDADKSWSDIFYIPFRTKLSPPEKVMVSGYNTPSDIASLTEKIKDFIEKNPRGIVMTKSAGTVMYEIFHVNEGRNDLGKIIRKAEETDRWIIYTFE